MVILVENVVIQRSTAPNISYRILHKKIFEVSTSKHSVRYVVLFGLFGRQMVIQYKGYCQYCC